MLEKFLENSGYIERKKNMILFEQRFVRENVLILFPAVTLRITVKWEELVLFPPADAEHL